MMGIGSRQGMSELCQLIRDRDYRPILLVVGMKAGLIGMWEGKLGWQKEMESECGWV